LQLQITFLTDQFRNSLLIGSISVSAISTSQNQCIIVTCKRLQFLIAHWYSTITLISYNVSAIHALIIFNVNKNDFNTSLLMNKDKTVLH